MATIIEGIELDETNEEFNYAVDFVQHSNKLVYLTGKAGTGKTTFLKYLREMTTKNSAILAPTGVAAVNAGGQTIHSFFQIKPSIYIPNDKRLRTRADKNDTDKSTIFDHFKYFKEKMETIRALELLVIDEISMVRCDLLDVVDRLLRVFRRRESEPFGGVQVVLIGDTFQLPPIADFEQWELLQPHYSSPFFFSSKVIEQNQPVYIELKKIYRQSDARQCGETRRKNKTIAIGESFTSRRKNRRRETKPSTSARY
ncbi:AAA family ATPase [Proteiniphilum sp.]|uniref:AAA family ATPase n=1 Tax=Proteiniphilum sp. TaxID=1926877 RepID=UPI00332081D9